MKDHVGLAKSITCALATFALAAAFAAPAAVAADRMVLAENFTYQT